MADTMIVVVTAIRTITMADGTLRELTVSDPTTGAIGALIVTAAEGQDLLGDCPTADLITVDRSRVVWQA